MTARLSPVGYQPSKSEGSRQHPVPCREMRVGEGQAPPAHPQMGCSTLGRLNPAACSTHVPKSDPKTHPTCHSQGQESGEGWETDGLSAAELAEGAGEDEEEEEGAGRRGHLEEGQQQGQQKEIGTVQDAGGDGPGAQP